MAAPSLQILRQQLREKFPQAHGVRADATQFSPRGKPFQPEAFPVGAISEVVPARADAGVSLLVAGLLGDPEMASRYPEMVLVDGTDSFDPNSFTGAACSKLLWVRCGGAMDMLKAADLLVRDGNVPFVLLDATGIARRELAALPAAGWWRLKLAVETGGGRLVVLAPAPLVPCASVRFSLSAGLSLHDFDSPRGEVLEKLRVEPDGLRRAT